MRGIDGGRNDSTRHLGLSHRVALGSPGCGQRGGTMAGYTGPLGPLALGRTPGLGAPGMGEPLSSRTCIGPALFPRGQDRVL